MNRMTMGEWICTECKYEEEVHLSSKILTCPKCKAKYTLIDTLKPHTEHEVYVTKSSTGKINVVRPIIIAFNDKNPEDVQKYFKILNSFYKAPEIPYIS